MSQFIGNRWIHSTQKTLQSINPATGVAVWSGVAANAAQVQEAVLAAQQSLALWRGLTQEGRAAHLHAYIHAIETHADEIARTISQEMGKPLWESRLEVAGAKNKLTISLRAYQERTGYHEKITPDSVQVLHHQAHGVLAILGPFNFPLHLPNGHLIPALLAGNTVVFKPSEYTPKTGEWIARCMEIAEMPAGVFNLIQGKAEVAQQLIAQPNINGVLFTGSYRAGSSIHQFFAGKPEVMLALEMGGNNPLVVTEVNDHLAASLLTIQSAFLTSGQRCTCARRLIIIDNQASQQFLASLIENSEGCRLGFYDAQPEPYIGPLVTVAAAQRALEKWQALASAGGKILKPLQEQTAGSALLSPGIIDVTEVANLPDEEIFAPVLQVIRVKNFEQAVVVANRTRYGLSAALISDNQNHFDYFSRHVRAGVINWNKPTTGSSGEYPFGGMGWSGNYRPSAYYAADYCAHPVVNSLTQTVKMPTPLPTGWEAPR